MKGVFFLVNSLAEFDFGDLIARHLASVPVTVGDSMPPLPSGYSLIVPWSYRHIIPGATAIGNIVVFHSSDLPRGRGWAPIYNAIVQDVPQYVITGIAASDDVDAGNILVKASFAMRPDYTAPQLRIWDDEICLMLIAQMLARLSGGWSLKGVVQDGEGSWNPRRRPFDGEVNADEPLREMVNHLRASEASHPAYLLYQGVRYNMTLTPAEQPVFPADLKIRFYEYPRPP